MDRLVIGPETAPGGPGLALVQPPQATSSQLTKEAMHPGEACADGRVRNDKHIPTRMMPLTSRRELLPFRLGAITSVLARSIFGANAELHRRWWPHSGQSMP